MAGEGRRPGDHHRSTGVEQISSLDDFAANHIQDRDAARAIAEQLARGEESRNVDLDCDVVEVYVAIDEEALAEALEAWDGGA